MRPRILHDLKETEECTFTDALRGMLGMIVAHQHPTEKNPDDNDLDGLLRELIDLTVCVANGDFSDVQTQSGKKLRGKQLKHVKKCHTKALEQLQV